MSDVSIIVADRIGKSYRIWKDPASRLKAPLFDALRSLIPARFRPDRPESSPYFHDFKALKDVSFSVRRGETIGIIGRNGSGKSTLLQIICGTLQPTSGTVSVNGRVAALLELGSGFNPEFTGRENVFLNASILGVSRDEIEKKLGEILSFADIGEFIDQPVKTYSSGMMVRLAFAVSVCIEPDLLIVDEALSVGDVFFQQKCFDRLRKLQEQGVSLLFVSHDMSAVRNLCDRCVLLNGGEVAFDGSPDDAVSLYYTMAAGTKAASSSGVAAVAPSGMPDASAKAAVLKNNILPYAKLRHGAKGMELVAAAFINNLDAHAFTMTLQEKSRIRVLLKSHADIGMPSVGILLYDRLNNLVFASSSRMLGTPLAPMRAGEERLVEIELTWNVQPEVYTFSLNCTEPSDESVMLGVIHDIHEGLGPVSVISEVHDRPPPFSGIAKLPLAVHAMPAQSANPATDTRS